MTDPITDMLNRIVNAQALLYPRVEIPLSNLKFEALKILEREKFIEKAAKLSKKRSIEVYLRYEQKIPAIVGFRRISKPGQRIYLPAKKIRRVRGGYGIAIISTSKGLMTDKAARKQKVGGEVMFQIW